MERQWRKLAVAAGLGALALGCVGAGYALSRDPGGGGDAGAPEGAPSAAAVDSTYTPPPIPAFQLAMLDDGLVTDEEMTAAVEATVACIEAATELDVIVLPSQRGVPRTFHFKTSTPVAPPAVESCRDELMEYVDMFYASEGLPPPTFVTKADVDAIFNGCVREHGLSVPAAGQRPEDFWTSEKMEEVFDGTAGDAVFRECTGRTRGLVALHSSEKDPSLYAPMDACLQYHGLPGPAPGQRFEEYWTPERLNGTAAWPEQWRIWNKCRVYSAAARGMP